MKIFCLNESTGLIRRLLAARLNKIFSSAGKTLIEALGNMPILIATSVDSSDFLAIDFC